MDLVGIEICSETPISHNFFFLNNFSFLLLLLFFFLIQRLKFKVIFCNFKFHTLALITLGAMISIHLVAEHPLKTTIMEKFRNRCLLPFRKISIHRTKQFTHAKCKHTKSYLSFNLLVPSESKNPSKFNVHK